MKSTGNRYDLQELAGAFADLGTLIPFVVGYITINRMDPAGVLVLGLPQLPLTLGNAVMSTADWSWQAAYAGRGTARSSRTSCT